MPPVVEMTRAEYEAKYGPIPPPTPSPVQPPVVEMTRAEYEAKYGALPGATQAPGVLESLATGLKSGALYQGYVAEPSAGLPAPTRGEVALANAQRTGVMTPEAQAYIAAEEAKQPGIGARLAQSIGAFVGTAPEFALGAVPGFFAGGPPGAMVGGMAAVGGTQAAQTGAGAVDIAKGTTIGAAEGALQAATMGAGGVVAGKVAPAALKAVAPVAGRLVGGAVGGGMAPALHGEMPSIQSFTDAAIMSLAFEAVPMARAAYMKRLKAGEAAGEPPQQSMEQAWEEAWSKHADELIAKRHAANAEAKTQAEPTPGTITPQESMEQRIQSAWETYARHVAEPKPAEMPAVSLGDSLNADPVSEVTAENPRTPRLFPRQPIPETGAPLTYPEASAPRAQPLPQVEPIATPNNSRPQIPGNVIPLANQPIRGDRSAITTDAIPSIPVQLGVDPIRRGPEPPRMGPDGQPVFTPGPPAPTLGGLGGGDPSLPQRGAPTRTTEGGGPMVEPQIPKKQLGPTQQVETTPREESVSTWRDARKAMESMSDAEANAWADQVLAQQPKISPIIEKRLAQFEDTFQQAAQAEGVPAELLKSVAAAESGGAVKAVSPKGAKGIMQFMDATAKQYGIDPLDPQQAIPAAARMLKERIEARGGDVDLALADYNYGQGNVDKALNAAGGDKATAIESMPTETKNYIKKVRSKMPVSGQTDAEGWTFNKSTGYSKNIDGVDVEIRKIKDARPEDKYEATIGSESLGRFAKAEDAKQYAQQEILARKEVVPSEEGMQGQGRQEEVVAEDPRVAFATLGSDRLSGMSQQKMKDTLYRYEVDTTFTGRDFVSEIKSLVERGEAPESLRSKLEAYENAYDLHKKSGYRMDDGEAEIESLANAVRDYVGATEESIDAVAPNSGGDFVVDLSSIKAANSERELNSIFGKMLSGEGKNFPNAEQQKIIRDAIETRSLELKSSTPPPVKPTALEQRRANVEKRRLGKSMADMENPDNAKAVEGLVAGKGAPTPIDPSLLPKHVGMRPPAAPEEQPVAQPEARPTAQQPVARDLSEQERSILEKTKKTFPDFDIDQAVQAADRLAAADGEPRTASHVSEATQYVIYGGADQARAEARKYKETRTLARIDTAYPPQAAPESNTPTTAAEAQAVPAPTAAPVAVTKSGVVESAPVNPRANEDMPQREQKKFLLSELERAKEGAISETDFTPEQRNAYDRHFEVNGGRNSYIKTATREEIDAAHQAVRDNIPHIEIAVPGDGVFTIMHTKEAIARFEKQAKAFPASPQTPFKPASVAASKTPSVLKIGTKAKDVPRAVAPFISTNKDRAHLTASHSNGERIVATNGHMMMVVKGNFGGTKDAPLRLSPDGGKVSVRSEFGFPDETTVIPPDNKMKSTFPRVKASELWPTINQASTITNEKYRVINVVKNQDGSVGMWATVPEEGEYVHNVRAGAEYVTSLDVNYLGDAIKAMADLGHDDIAWMTSKISRTGEMATVIRSKDGSATAMIMPVRAGEYKIPFQDAPTSKPTSKPKRTPKFPNPSDPQAGFVNLSALAAVPPRLKKVYQKYFTSRGDLPEQAFSLRNRMTGERGEMQNQANRLVADYGRAMRDVYGKKDPPANVKAMLNAVLDGDAPDPSLPRKAVDATLAFRDGIDALSRRMVREGLVSEDMANIIKANEGEYVRRTYKVDRDPNYIENIDPKVRANYKNYLRREMPDLSDAQLDQRINAMLEERRVGGDPFATTGSGVSKDLSLFKKRTNLPKELRELYGEDKDPKVRFVQSITAMSDFIAKQRFLTDVRKAGMGKFFFEEGDPKIDPRASVQIAADTNKTLAPLNGLYTYPEVADALKQSMEPKSNYRIFEAYMKANATAKYSKVVLSPKAQIRQSIGNNMFLVANGHNPFQGETLRGVRTAWQHFRNTGSKDAQAYMNKLVRLGVLDDSASAGELSAVLRDAGIGDSTLAKAPAKMYQLGDNWQRVTLFELEKAQYKAAYPDWTDAQLDAHAAEIVANQSPTYSRASQAIRDFRRFPLVGPFATFSAEVVRTSKNIIKQTRAELKSDNAAVRKIGAKRLAGMITAGGLSAGGATASMLALGVSRQDDKDLRKFAAPWMQNGNWIYTDIGEDSKVRIIDTSYTDPYAYISKIVMAGLNGDDITDAVVDMGKELLGPFGQEQLLTSALIDVVRNQAETGKEIYSETDSPAEATGKILKRLYEAFEPGGLTDLRRIERGLAGKGSDSGRPINPYTEMAGVATGQRVQEIDPLYSLQFKAREFQRNLSESTSKFTSVARRPDAQTADDLMSAKESASEARKRAFDEIIEMTAAADRLGIPRRKVVMTLKKAGVSTENIGRVLHNKPGEFRPPKDLYENPAVREVMRPQPRP